MSQIKKPRAVVEVYEQFPLHRKPGTQEVTLEQVKKYLSTKPLRRGPPRNTASTDRGGSV